MSSNLTPIKYVLYSHYGYNEREDFEAYKKNTPIADLAGIRFLLDHFRGLKELLTSPGFGGMLVLFYAPGYQWLLEGLAQRKPDEEMMGKTGDASTENQRKLLCFARDVARYIQEQLQIWDLADQVRFLTSLDLRVILGRVNDIFAGSFGQYFIGPATGIRYDSPKVIEAILRLRALGHGLPVLRVDHDVIFRDTNTNIGDLGLFKAIACAVRAYELRMDQPTVSTFLFSTSYNTQALLKPTKETDRFEAWSRAFATRIYPALVVNDKEIIDICKLPEKTNEEKTIKNNKWNRYVETNLDDTLARKFYGLKKYGLKSSGTDGLTSIGAHPLYSVISGALLCLSEGAILDLPPFSNLGMNVMWIDDHLKYSLHRAMDHFTSGETLDLLEPGLRDARLDNVMVTKGRPSVSNLHTYIFDIYLPTLLWGAIMDAWITIDPILKCRYSSLDPKGKVKWRNAKANQEKAPLPSAMLVALRNGNFSKISERRLRDDLEKSAFKRIEEVRQLWAGLKTDSKETFASLWAEGTVKKNLGESIFTNCTDFLWHGIAPNPNQPIKQLDDLYTSVGLKVEKLIQDTIDYVHWTLEWPRFVQIVRSIRQGDFMGDLTWHPK